MPSRRWFTLAASTMPSHSSKPWRTTVVGSAIVAARAAMTEHDRLAMPFERARSQLLLGRLQRRVRRREAATSTLREALSAFEAMGTPLWAARARA